MRRKIFRSTIIFTLSTITLLAQTTDSVRTLDLSEVNVVGARVEKNNIETPASITVLTSNQIIQAGYTSVADALSETAGIYITGTGQNPGANESIFMRGANSNQTVILIDGIRISDASTVNNTADLSELSISNVDKIEIIRGSHSTLYGSGAVGGIVSITTKNMNKKGLTAKAALTGGTFQKETFDARASALLGYHFKQGMYANAGIEKIAVAGADATMDTVTDPSKYKNRDKDDWDKLSYHANAGYRNKKLNADVNYSVTEMKTDLDKGAYTDDDNYKLKFNRNMINGTIGWKPGSIISSQLSAGYTDTKRHSVNDSSIEDQSGNYDHNYIESTYSGKYASADWQLNAHFTNVDFLIGLSGVNEDMKQEDYYYSTAYGLYESRTNLDSITPVSTMAAYLHTEIRGTSMHHLIKGSFSEFTDRLTLSGGARLSNHSLIKSQIAYDVSVSLKTGENALLYFTHSTGYNNPSLYQLYAPTTYTPLDGSASTGLTLGNSELKAEASRSFEIGFKQNTSAKFQYAVSFFHSVTEDLIEYVFLWDKAIGIDTLGNDPWNRDDYRGDRYLNIGKQTTTGIEIDIRTYLSPKLLLEANASLVSGKIEYNSSGTISSQTNGENVQLYSTGAFLGSRTRTGSLVRRPSEATLKLVYSPVTRLHIAPSLRFVTSRNDVFYESSLGPYGALAVNVIDAYTLAGLSFNWNAGRGFNLNMKGENLLNEKYEEIHGFTTRSRSLYVTISYSY